MAHWTANEKQLAQLRASAKRHGFDSDAAICTVVGAPSLDKIRDDMGTVLMMLAKQAKGKSNGGTTTRALVLSEEQHRNLYKDDEQFRRGQAVRQLAKWANGDYPMTDSEIALMVIRGDTTGLDVFNAHEVQIYKDKHGIQWMLAYTLVAQWADRCLGGHTQPRYNVLSEEETDLQGIPEGEGAIRCAFMMNKDIDRFIRLVSGGIDQDRAEEMCTRTGIATVKGKDWNNKYFAPNGRSKMWKLQKRAYVDAIRTNFGEPGYSEIVMLRRERGEQSMRPQDWQVGAGDGPVLIDEEYNTARRLRIEAAAQEGKRPEPTTGGDGEEAADLLYGELDASSNYECRSVPGGEMVTIPDGDGDGIDSVSFVPDEPYKNGEADYIETETEPLRKIEHPPEAPKPDTGMTLLKANNTKFFLPSKKRPELQGKILSEVWTAAPEIVRYLASDEYKASTPNTVTLKEAARFLVEHHTPPM